MRAHPGPKGRRVSRENRLIRIEPMAGIVLAAATKRVMSVYDYQGRRIRKQCGDVRRRAVERDGRACVRVPGLADRAGAGVPHW